MGVIGLLADASSVLGGVAAMNETFEPTAAELEQLVLSRLAESGISGEFRAVRGDPRAELTKIAEQVHADAVVVGASEQLGYRIVG